MSNFIEFHDKIAFHPGYYIKETIENIGLTQEDFAKRLNTTPKNLSELIRGKQSLSIDIAMKLSRMLGTSVNYWLNLQSSYDTLIAQMKSEIEGTVASEKAQKKANKIAKNYNLSEEEQEVVKKVYGGLLDKEQQFKEKVEATGKKYNELSNAEKLELLEKIGLTQEEAEASIYDAYGKKKPTGDEVDAAR